MRFLADLPTLRQVRARDPDRFRHGLHREPPFGGDGGSRSCFFEPVACSSASLSILGFQGLLAE